MRSNALSGHSEIKAWSEKPFERQFDGLMVPGGSRHRYRYKASPRIESIFFKVFSCWMPAEDSVFSPA